ncbi:neuronal acetylcholine receptor subunit alpha-7-like [Siniperca chuatsi]|uniref:neuronal acetylcholine receptor subunit alpha-7-like n=1 Tax=Siniperca chuatsi TaxID=119488 RepID=UPI001CE21803|nr:neuronal acetylcholine receptor subunit alpha-7-like [Siniperca chuatsi]XP_044061196.1 neuronal acetylcholine receptor subunit alpha-7-like [Siniperca chuatsi]
MRCHKFWGPCSVGFYICAAILFKGSLQGEHQRRLYKELLANYNRLERPVVNDSAAILVELGLTLLQIIDVDEKNQVLMTNAWLQLYWTDIYLSWNPEKYPGVQNLRFPSDQIWTPDILLYNSADERFDATFHTNVLVNASGYCQYIPPGILKSTCYIDVRWFPFDVQKCDLKFGSWTHNGWLLDLQMLDVDTSTYIPNGEWDLVGVPAKRNELYYECCKEPYPDVTFTVTMRRRTLYYGLNLLIPCVLISGLALLVFLLPADSGEKISLGITVLLSLTVFMLLVAEIMPATSDSVPLIAQYFASTMMIVGMSVVVTVIVLQFHHHDPQGGKMPKWVRVVLLNWCAWFLRMKQPGDERKRSGYKYRHTSQHHSSTSSIEMGTVPSLSVPLSQTSCPPCPTGTSNGSMSLYFGNYHPIESPHCPPSSDSGVALGGRAHGSLSDEAEPPGGVGSGVGGLGMGVGVGMGVNIPPPEIRRILEEVSYIAQRFRDQDEAEAICSEWKFAAAVVDRLCLVAFSLFSIICTFTILMSAPNFIEAVSKDFT